ncbi:hypothetical protein AN191_02135 [Loktanella sp. 5RATIMAR09]|uniref:DUF2478 domain-containing protein n=1 Tax=Loktanella sp. 5RATIMAR09 TaxID=1225655 RepID=UPI0006EBBFF7|nr:DUF2478 domain-containing protein [Loktanella sp. 5RATIMAR09]KQI73693.1 hypothetical protein AN191_02135 [Loktanella sp. 5RATIMAR09]
MTLLASITPTARGAADQLLTYAVKRLGNDGVKVLGALRDFGQSNASEQCDSALRLLPDGPVVRITQDLGKGSTACKMDAGALEDAVGIAVTRLAVEGADLVVLNKFGLREAEGHGFRPLIANALASGIPVLLGVSDTHRAAFDRFADGMATTLTPDEEAILTWCKTAIVPRPDAATR